MKKLQGIYRLAGTLIFIAGVLFDIFYVANLTPFYSGIANCIAFIVILLVSGIASLPLFAIDEHLDNQSAILSKLDEIAHKSTNEKKD